VFVVRAPALNFGFSAAVETAHAVAPHLPIVAQMTFVEERRTIRGHSPEDVAAALCGLGVTAAGANCSAGPAIVLRVVPPSGLISLINHNLNLATDQAGNSIGRPTGFVVGCALNMADDNSTRSSSC
jgi:hypothetical protein